MIIIEGSFFDLLYNTGNSIISVLIRILMSAYMHFHDKKKKKKISLKYP